MGIEIAEKSKETRVKQASMLNTQRSLFGLKHLYRSILSTYLPLICGETTVFYLTACLHYRSLWMRLLQFDPDRFFSTVYTMKVKPAPITIKTPTIIIFIEVEIVDGV